jgi:hypothetical protein
MLKTLQKKQDYGVRWVTFTLSALTGQDYANTIVFPQLKPCQGKRETHDPNALQKSYQNRAHFAKQSGEQRRHFTFDDGEEGAE